MLAAYLDESGHKDTKILCVAGYVATGEQWRKFSNEWNSIIKPEGIEVFHMTDFETGHGDFEGWAREKRDRLFERLSQTINHSVIYETWVAVDVEECDRILREIDKDFFANSYVLCGTLCIFFISNWAKRHWKREPVVITFEEGRKFSGDMSKLWELMLRREWLRDRYKISNITKDSKKNSVPLQAAGVIAYEMRLRYNNPSAPSRPYLRWLAYSNYKGKFLTGHELRAFAKMANDDFDKYANPTYLVKRNARRGKHRA
ncbi:MAG: DUF3800 domain-containing protein [Acidobacteria bacterium]|nr:DUF3800 domain-containing protein [Acidobacteriota bacterium]